MKRSNVTAAALALAALLLSVLPAAAQPAPNVPCYMEQGGAKFVAASGCEIEVRAGGVLDIQAGLSQGITVRASTNIGAGDLVYLSSYHASDAVYIAAIADADVAGGDARYLATAAITSGSTGVVYRAGSVTMDTQGATVGDPVYLTITGTTTNTLSLSAPSGVDDRTVIVGRVTSVAASGGVLVDLTALAGPTIISGTQIRDESIATGDILDATIAAADIATSGVATAEILDGTILNEDVGAAAAIARTKLAEDALAGGYGVELRTTTFAVLGVAEAAGTFNFGLGTNLVNVLGEVTDNETETSVGYFVFILPPEYVAAGDVTVRFRSQLDTSGSPTDNGSTLDLSCYEQADGAVGADIVSTAAATFAALDTYYSKDFALTASGLVAGDTLVCKITTAIIDSEAGGGTITWTSDPVKVLLDVQG